MEDVTGCGTKDPLRRSMVLLSSCLAVMQEDCSLDGSGAGPGRCRIVVGAIWVWSRETWVRLVGRIPYHLRPQQRQYRFQ